MHKIHSINSFNVISQFAKTIVIGTSIGIFSTSISMADEQVSASKIASMLNKGGYVVYLRHTSTEKDYADQVTADVNNCSTQRTLSEKGWNEANLIGSSFSILNIPIGALYSSEYCRAWKTARIAFGVPIKQAGLNFQAAEDFTPAQIATMSAAVTPMLSTPPQSGTNTVIVGHDDPFEAATGIYPEPQGVAYVVKPERDGKFTIVGSIKPTDWPSILSANSN